MDDQSNNDKRRNLSDSGKPVPPALPETAADYLAQRKLKEERDLNDLVEDIHLKLYDDQKYKRFRYATYDEQAVEGSIATDNSEAARMIRDYAKKNDIAEVAEQKLATIGKIIGVVERRYGQSRKERRNRVGGKIVPGDNGD